MDVRSEASGSSRRMVSRMGTIAATGFRLSANLRFFQPNHSKFPYIVITSCKGDKGVDDLSPLFTQISDLLRIGSCQESSHLMPEPIDIDVPALLGLRCSKVGDQYERVRNRVQGWVNNL